MTLLMRIAPLLACLLAGTACAADVAGRWEGMIEIPGAPQRIVVDLAPGAGAWAGSTILPGRGVKGAPLGELDVKDGRVRARVSAEAEVALSLQANGELAGEMRMGGNAAAVTLRRTGNAQVDFPIAATAVTRQISGTWVGRYELAGVPRDVTLKVANGERGAASGELLIVGKRRTTLPVDRVVQGREFVSFESTGANFRIEGRWTTPDGTIQGQMTQGPFEAPIVLRRAPGGAS